MGKEKYHKPAIISEMIEIGVYGNGYGGGDPIPELQPFFHLCCP